MPFSDHVLAQTADPAPPCGPPERSSWLCELVESTTGEPGLARAADVLIARPAAVLLILIVAWIVQRLARRGIRRLVARSNAEGSAARSERSLALRPPDPAAPSRKAQRTEALGTLMSSVTGVVIWAIAGLMALDKLGFNLGPLLAGAGVLGIAIGFGSQTLVRDFLSGIFMLVEDQFGVGDVIDVGDATGTVESVTLRTTRLRSVDGVLWHVPNGEIRRIGNKSQQWSRALIDVPVAYATDLGEATALIQRVADTMAEEPEWRDKILGPPEVWGLERFDADALAIRTVITTVPLEQWAVARELRRLLKNAFSEAGIEIPFPQRTIWLRADDPAALDMIRSAPRP
jgi:moderate conductance mechanosensitive channel